MINALLPAALILAACSPAGNANGDAAANTMSAAGTGTQHDASEWRLDKNTSSVRFEVTAFGNIISGAFEDFDAEITLDPGDLSGARIDATVRTASLEGLGSSDVRQNLRGEKGLDVDDHPRARFVSEDVRRTQDGYEAVGELTIKNQTREITLPFTLDISDGRAVADGRFTLDRTDFNVGEGWGEVEEQVTVIVHVEADAAE